MIEDAGLQGSGAKIWVDAIVSVLDRLLLVLMIVALVASLRMLRGRRDHVAAR